MTICKFWFYILPSFQLNLYVSQWASTITWPFLTGFTSELTCMPQPPCSGRSQRNVKISPERRGVIFLKSIIIILIFPSAKYRLSSVGTRMPFLSLPNDQKSYHMYNNKKKTRFFHAGLQSFFFAKKNIISL